MKKITLLAMFFVCLLTYGQVYEVPSCSNLGSSTYGPMNSVAGANATNRTAVIYPASQLSTVAGQVLTSVYFKRSTASGTMAGTPNLKIYLKETTSTDWGTGSLTWDTTVADASLVFDGNPATIVGSTAGWKSFPLTGTFTYSGTQNLVVLMEYQNTTASTAIQWNYEYTSPCVNTSNSNTTKYSNNTSGTFPALLSSSDYRRPLIAFDIPVTCSAPDNIVADTPTTNSVNISWNASSSVPANGYDYYISTTNTAPLPAATPTGSVAAGVTSVSLTMLPPATTHYVWVRANCDTDGVSLWRSGASFTTQCAVLVPTVTESFTTFPPNCWTRAAAGDLSTGPTGTGTGIWVADGFLNSGTTGAVRVNLYSTNRIGWLITPTIDMSAGNYRAKFRIGSTDYGNSNPTEMADMPDGDVVIFAMSEDDGLTWTALRTWEGANIPPNAGTLVNIPLPTNVSATTKFAFYTNDGTIDTADDYEIFIDDFAVETIPACEFPINLVASGVTFNSATIQWSAIAGSVGYEYVLDNDAAEPTGAGMPLATNTYTETGTLTPSTTYYFHVRNNCDGEYSPWSTLSFTTRGLPPANDNCADAISVTPNADLLCGTVVSGTLVEATDSGEGDNGAGTPNDDVWYSFVATSSTHRITLSNVQGTPTDLVHEVLEGFCGGGLISLNVSDPNSSDVAGLIVGNTYYVRIFTFGTPVTNTVTFDLCIGSFPPPPANDNCADALVVLANNDGTCTNTISGTLASATDSGEGDNGAGTPNDDVWYSFIATATEHQIRISNVQSTPTDLVHEVLEGTCGGGLISLVVSDPDTSLVSGLIVGNSYYVRVFSNAATAGATTTFDLCVSTPPVGSVCTNPIVVTSLPYTTTDNTNLYGDDYNFPTGGASGCSATSNYYLNGDDVVYAYTPSVNQSINIRIPGAPGWSGMLVYTDCAAIGTGAIACASGSGTGNREINNLFVTAGTTYYIVLSTYPSPQSFAYTLNITANSCINPIVTFTNSNNCPTPGFYVSADISDLGSATSLTVTDNQSSAPQTVTATGTVQFGPYDFGTSVILTVTNNQDPTCFVASTAQMVDACPPANDDCAGAIELIPSADTTCASTVEGTTIAATQSLPGCLGTANDDVWYKFTATATDHRIVTNNVSGAADIVTQVFDACGGTSLVCQDTPNSPINLTGLTVGSTYVFRIYTYSSTATIRTTFNVCVQTVAPPPPPPANDNCAGAIALTPGPDFATNAIVGDFTSATTVTGLTYACQTNRAFDVWYSVVVPASGNLTIETKTNTGTDITDTVMSVFSGACGSLVEVDCDDDDGDGNFSLVTLTGRTPGETLYVGVWKYGTTAATASTFQVSAHDESLSNTKFDSADFKAYPNPVNSILNLSYVEEISSVQVYNLVGQQVITKKIGSTQAALDMSNLAHGTYLVKVAVGDSVKTIKVMKN
ncbi:T9SS type A sorting domain-containing protein [Flavobacterium sp. NST-5]|uniref:T9SS type A sorting domain-containing protein n=1 Tax=Flavobacterium ichthyis TaxID=2698827 RepID=A0ABW9Z612_9FLAO|nr:T9SS type A sorting domain-containing protein [Flavobacterium ichthyis]NBL64277.1 T9SS type A sorting domain-containing protein [Flavobacterium ichthyis]